MKKLLPPLLLALTLVITSFTNNPKSENTNFATRYAFVTDTEWDKALDEPGNNGYVSLTTDIVSVACDVSKDQIKSQYVDHYNAEEKTENRERAFIGAKGITSAWIYDTYDDALKSRRDWMAKETWKHKTQKKNQRILCNL